MATTRKKIKRIRIGPLKIRNRSSAQSNSVQDLVGTEQGEKVMWISVCDHPFGEDLKDIADCQIRYKVISWTLE